MKSPMFFKTTTKNEAAALSASIERLKKEIQEADAIVIDARAGVSTSAGFIYSGDRFRKSFSDFKGRIKESSYTAKKYRPGIVFDYTVYISKYYDSTVPAALIIEFDDFCQEQASAMEKLVASRKAPVFVIVGIKPGKLPPSISGGFERFFKLN